MIKWNKGHPPKPGWWVASIDGMFDNIWRWFDGQYWSAACNNKMTAEHAARCACEKSLSQDAILWSDYYPENARVPRN